jgi:RNA polymerase sigma-70 factor (ECF subfamily)
MNRENNTTMNEFAELLRREQSHFMRYACYRLGDTDDAKDALQETCHKLCDKFTADDDNEVKNLRNYIFRTLANVCTTRLSQSKRLETIPLDPRFDMADIQSESNEDDLKRIVKLLDEIPEEQAEVIRLRIYGDNSFAEVSDILSVPLPTVKSRFLYGLEKIRRAMKQTN